MTLTEQRLARMWSRCAVGGQPGRWLDLNRTLWEISSVLTIHGAEHDAQMFSDAAMLALRRYIDDVVEHHHKAAA